MPLPELRTDVACMTWVGVDSRHHADHENI